MPLIRPPATAIHAVTCAPFLNAVTFLNAPSLSPGRLPSNGTNALLVVSQSGALVSTLTIVASASPPIVSQSGMLV